MGNTVFYIDEVNSVCKSYQDLISDLQSLDSYCPYCYTHDYYRIFKSVIHSLLLGRELVLLDSDFSTTELKELIGKEIIDRESESPCEILSDLTFDNLYEMVRSNIPNWKITLFTSGTTGIPKKVSHNYSTITRFVKSGKHHSDDIWGFAYNPTHIAGLQVFFQAFLNCNLIIRLFGNSQVNIFSSIANYNVTHISATPTFYRLLLPTSTVYPSVRRVTSGGEKFDTHTSAQLLQVFPNALLTNVYASTEAGTLFAAKGDNFIIKSEMIPFIKVENDILYLHKTLMGESKSIKLDEDWYNTGDLIEVISNTPFEFRFVSRQNEMINVGGYKVNPTEVEQCIREIDGIQDVLVFAKKNHLLGNVICCDVVCCTELSELSIRTFLMKRLQEFKIPRFIRFVDSISTTRTGKLARI